MPPLTSGTFALGVILALTGVQFLALATILMAGLRLYHRELIGEVVDLTWTGSLVYLFIGLECLIWAWDILSGTVSLTWTIPAIILTEIVQLLTLLLLWKFSKYRRGFIRIARIINAQKAWATQVPQE